MVINLLKLNQESSSQFMTDSYKDHKVKNLVRFKETTINANQLHIIVDTNEVLGIQNRKYKVVAVGFGL